MDNEQTSPNNIYTGPQRLSLPSLGYSVYIPYGWIAGIVDGELYGIEPVQNTGQGKDSRIYVSRINGSFANLQHSMNISIDLDYLTLEPASPLVVELKLASARFYVTGHALFRHAWVSALSIASNQNILFVALDSEEISNPLKTITHELAGSVKLLNSPVIPFNNENRKTTQALT